ncbi:MAG TPA: DNA polymerase III subunit gamma/tau [Fermentimonas caenicola]|jgi:DNA polymerase-3 subunit gamma/tau|nr:DNA polymerase III subunit gamma/tau [Bacteroidota bacterium]TAH62315.1 MAG: DNA polymerase III subunit gamma/tau [Fermentimonas caenicola]HHU42605.1 DNA polymerase III subunit gamma/tau [Fermentimonas caenicola]
MDTFIVSARKYRPSTFKSVVGQEALTTTLKNAIVGNKLAHAYLFSGPRGVGKTTCARIFAKTINCMNLTPDNEACNNCESCVAFNQQRSYNIHELDAASNNGVDDIRMLIEQVRIPPQIGKYKVYIIDEVHMLSQSAFNSFLKTLEEPPSHAIFILATTEKHKIIPTILSRCQVYDFNRINIADIVEHLQYVAQEEGVTAEAEALNVIAQKADGGMRDALSIFDQTASFTQGNITYRAVIENLNVLDYEYYFRLTNAILAGNVVDCLLILNDILNRGFEGQYIISGVASHFRDLLVCKDPKTASLFEVGASIRDQYIDTAKQCSNEFLYKAIEIANECDLNYRVSKNRRLLLELTLIKLCQLQENPTSAAEKKSSIKPIEKTASESKTSQTEVKRSDATPKAETAPIQKKTEQTPDETSKPTTPVKKKSALKGMGISILSLRDQKEEEPEEEKKASTGNGNNPFTEKELKEAWDEYAANLKGEPLLKNTMSLYHPRLISDVIFEVEVNTEINKEYLTNSSLSILSFLRSKVKNDDLTMTIKIAEGNAIKKPLTSREIFDEMAKKNPSLLKLSDEFGLELN